MKKHLVWLFTLLLSISNLGAKTIVFLHGGPGLNSNPEAHILASYLSSLKHEAFFWNEPSDLRPDGEHYNNETAFGRAVESAEKFVTKICQDKVYRKSKCELTLMAHSFAVHYAVRLAQKFKKQIVEIILISPGLNINDADKNILKLAMNDLEKMGHSDVSNQIASLLPLLKEEFDQNKMQAFILGSQDGALFVNYWSDLNLMQAYFSYVVGEYAFDAKGMFAVRATLPKIEEAPSEKISIPTSVYFGELDPVTPAQEQIPALKKYFSNLAIHILTEAKHYPHIEGLNKIKY
jgi:pimeloyl-ACP methyl ester carboxylesterase